MRLSRKAGLLTCGVKWIKYNCTKKTTDNGRYLLGAQNAISGVWDTTGTKSYTGYSGYTFDRKAGTVYASGAQTTVSKANPGAVYEGGGQTIYGYAARSDGYYHTFSRTVVYEIDTTVTYTIGSLVGTVYAAEGEYPDTGNGYRYVTNDNGYTIMRNPATGHYYAYWPTESSTDSPDSPDSAFSATIEDGVLTVAGDGTATISDDNVLIVEGSAGSAVSNNILYVR